VIIRSLLHRHALPALLALSVLLLLPAYRSGSRNVAYAAAAGCSVNRSLVPDGEEAAMLTRINAYRAGAGLVSLTQSSTLTAAAAWKAADLGANGYFAHDDLGRSWSQRLSDCGYSGTPNIAENLAAGYADAESTFQQWRESAGHNANMLNPAMRAIGVARAYTSGSPFGWYWATTFGAIADSGQSPSPAPAPPSPPPTSANASANAGSLTMGATRQPSPAPVTAWACIAHRCWPPASSAACRTAPRW
jgi:uncharacterized protein YkwD